MESPFKGRQTLKFTIREDDAVKVRKNSIGKFFVRKDNFHASILTHEHQAIFRELAVEWHISTSGLHHRHRVYQNEF